MKGEDRWGASSPHLCMCVRLVFHREGVSLQIKALFLQKGWPRISLPWLALYSLSEQMTPAVKRVSVFLQVMWVP